jgi:uncharacterized tellurite resistance protein B-like protein
MTTDNTKSNKSDNKLIVNTLNNLFAENNRTKQKLQSQQAKNGVTKRDLELALTTVLVDLAASDQNFQQQEYHMITVGLQSLFGTAKTEITGLVNQAVSNLKNLRGTTSSAKLLRENLNDEQKKLALQSFDAVMETDGVEDGFEVYLRTKFVDILGIKF